MYLILTYFNQVRGPVIYISIPEEIPDEKIRKKITGFLNLDLGETFFQVTLVEEQLKTINLYFEIPSPWTRGNEMALLTVVSEKNYKDSLFFDLLTNTHQKIESTENIYKAFHKNDDLYDDDLEIDVKYEKLKGILLESFDKIQKILESSYIGGILILGLSNVGKSSLINRMKKKVFSPNIKPTLALTLIELIIDNYLYKIIDVSGQKKLRYQWWTYTKHPDAIIFVLDVNDIVNKGQRLKETKEEFEKIIKKYSEKGEDALSDKTPLLICANKIDLAKNIKVEDIEKLLNLKEENINYKIQLTSAVTGEGIERTFRWLVKELMTIS